MACFLGLATALILLAGGQFHNAQADDPPTEITTKVYVVDTKGNQLKAPEQFTVTATNSNVNCVNVSVPGYNPVETASSVKFGIDPAFQTMIGSSSRIMSLDVPNKRVVVTDQPVDPDAAPKIEYMDMAFLNALVSHEMMQPFNTISEGFVNLLEGMKAGISFNGAPQLSMQFYGQLAPSSITVIYKYQPASATVNYVNDKANGAIVTTDSFDGFVAKTGEYTPVAPAGYQLVDPKPIAYTLAKDTNNLTVHVVPKTAPVVPSGPSDNPVPAKQESSTTPTVPTPSKQPTVTEQPAVPNYAAVKGAAVYATKGIYLYKTANFKNSQRIAKYPKVKRVNRPMFVVVNYARSTNGTLRYKVRDVNHGSKTAGKVGYITANRKYVVPVYYQTMPKNDKMTVINKKGVNAYKQVNLTHKITNYKKGTRLTVKKIVKHNLTTRYQLANGNYITGNKKLVIQGNY
ncbi:hypothetical protein LRA02_09530 [Lentilactobacillus rapi]|uniref:DUF5776 domain-containing protein n=2 Tax=Lentilactobacillus rapi TaxID=481723 RepID=A0A512PLL9_9LACO|nr:hypothetical protein LRA02_09530 [Lentilactobacillus rapi]